MDGLDGKTAPIAKRNRALGRLAAVAVRKLGPGMHLDGGGLFLAVSATGGRSWVLRVTVRGKRRDVGLGSVEAVSLKEAREKAAEMRRIARAGGDPVAEREKARRGDLTFAEAARSYHGHHVAPHARNVKHAAQWISTIEAYAVPVMGARPVALADQADVLKALSPIWIAKPETARRVRQRLAAVFDWAIAAGHRRDANPVTGVERGLPKQRAAVSHFAALP